MKTRRWLRLAAGILFCGSLLLTITGCAGNRSGRSGGGVVVTGPLPPDVVVFGGDYDNGRDVHEYSQRGYESREDYVHRDQDSHHEPAKEPVQDKDHDHDKDQDSGHKD